MYQDILKQKRETFHISIRKERHEAIFKNKRRLLISGNSTPETIDPSNIKDFAIEWAQLLNEGCVQRDTNTLIQTLNTINALLIKPDSYHLQKLEAIRDANLLVLFNQIFVEQDSPNEVMLKIYVNLFCYEVFDDLEQLEDQKFIAKLHKLLENPQYQSSIYYILANLVGRSGDDHYDKAKKEVLLNHSFITRIEELWEKKVYEVGQEQFEIFTWFINNFIDNTKLPNRIVYRLLQFVLILEGTEHISVQSNLLSIMSTACRMHDEHITFLVSQGMHLWAINRVNVPELRAAALYLLTDMGAGKLKQVEKLLEQNLLDIFVGYLKEDKKQRNGESYIFRIILCISNMMDTLKKNELIMKIIQHQLLVEIVALSFDLNKHGVREYTFMIKNLSTIQTTNYKDALRKVLLMENFIESIIYHLDPNYGEEIVEISLESIHTMAQRFESTQISDANFVIEIFNSRGFEEKLSHLHQGQSTKLSQMAHKMLELYYA